MIWAATADSLTLRPLEVARRIWNACWSSIPVLGHQQPDCVADYPVGASPARSVAASSWAAAARSAAQQNAASTAAWLTPAG